MFRHSARYYDAIYSFKDYAGESARVSAEIELRRPGAASLLDVACGTGAHLVHFARRYQVEGLDISAEQLEVARTRLDGVPLHHADMTSFELGRSFDAVVCLFSSIGYVATVERLDAAVARMAAHLSPGGVLVVEPWLAPEDYIEGHISSLFVDEPEVKVARIALSHLEGRLSVFEMEHLIGTPEGVEHFVERHELAMFTQAEYRAAFERTGLSVERDPEGLIGRGLYIGVAGYSNAPG